MSDAIKLKQVLYLDKDNNSIAIYYKRKSRIFRNQSIR